MNQLIRDKGRLAKIVLTFSFLVYLYDRLTKPPKNLRHIPRWSIFSFFSLLRKFDTTAEAKKISQDVLKKSGYKGLCLRVDVAGWVLQVSDPVLAKHVLLKTGLFPKVEFAGNDKTLYRRFFGQSSILFSDGAEWRIHRNVINPAFHRSLPIKLFGSYFDRVIKVIDDSKESVNVTDLFRRYSLDIIGKGGFNFDFNAIAQPKDNEWLERILGIHEATRKPLFFYFPFLETYFLCMLPKRKQWHKELDMLYEMVDELIEQRRKFGTNEVEENEKDLLTLMLESETNEEIPAEKRLTNSQIKADIIAFFIAGHDTSSNALSYISYFLAVNQDIQEKARQEAIDILGDSKEHVYPTIEHTKQASYIDRVIKEGMRIKPSVSHLSNRVAKKDTYLGDTFIPKGTLITICLNDLMNNPTKWDNPDEFNIDRFLPTDEVSEGIKYAPFSFGARTCVGLNFAMAEMRTVLLMLLRKYTWTLPKDSIHKDGVISKGLNFSGPYNLELDFIKRY